jgi:hypothetical protein
MFLSNPQISGVRCAPTLRRLFFSKPRRRGAAPRPHSAVIHFLAPLAFWRTDMCDKGLSCFLQIWSSWCLCLAFVTTRDPARWHQTVFSPISFIVNNNLVFPDWILFPASSCFSDYTGWSKSHATHSWHIFVKGKLHWNKKTINNVILSVGHVHRVQRCMHSLFFSCLMQPCEEFLCHGNGSPDEILLIFCLAQENREMYP